MKLSIIIPVFNEEETITQIVERVRSVPLDTEIVMIDDASSDRSRDILYTFQSDSIKVVHHDINRGKGAAIATGLRLCTGDVVVIQDADLEYDPRDFIDLIKPIEAGQADVVYGVRDLTSQKPLMRFGNRFLTVLTNVLYGGNLNDMETCYKMMTRPVFERLDLECRRFDVEPEITAKILRMGFKIHEVPIHYEARHENKKLSPFDGWPALRALLKYRLMHIPRVAPRRTPAPTR